MPVGGPESVLPLRSHCSWQSHEKWKTPNLKETRQLTKPDPTSHQDLRLILSEKNKNIKHPPPTKRTRRDAVGGDHHRGKSLRGIGNAAETQVTHEYSVYEHLPGLCRGPPRSHPGPQHKMDLLAKWVSHQILKCLGALGMSCKEEAFLGDEGNLLPIISGSEI